MFAEWRLKRKISGIRRVLWWENEDASALGRTLIRAQKEGDSKHVHDLEILLLERQDRIKELTRQIRELECGYWRWEASGL